MRNTFMVVVLLISATAIGFAQVDTGSLVGTVKDPSGAALALLHVIAYNPAVATRAIVRARRKPIDTLSPQPGSDRSTKLLPWVDPIGRDDDTCL